MSDRYLCKAKRTDNGKWVEGFYMPRPNLPEGEQFYIVTPGSCVWFEIDPSTLFQHTGLPDKDKTKMYENDIVRANGGVHGVIRFGKYGDMKTDYGFYIEWDKSQPYWRNDICYWQDEIKVIGSYIDNPELLEGGAE